MRLDDYQEAALSTATYPDPQTLQGLLYTVLKLNGEAGELAEHAGKILRDDDGVMTMQRLKAMRAELGDVLWYVASTAHELGMTLDEVAQDNLEKLASRKARGVLKGSGSDR